jgi:hypothetical protein
VTLLHLDEIAVSIAALTIPGVTAGGVTIPAVTVLDLDQMPDAVDARRLPLLGPSSHEPAFLTDWESLRVSFQGNQRNTYTLNYTLFFAPVGAERGLFKQYPAMVACAQTVVGVFQAHPSVTGCQQLTVLGLPRFGPVFDASGQQFHGATLALRIIEF